MSAYLHGNKMSHMKCQAKVLATYTQDAEDSEVGWFEVQRLILEWTDAMIEDVQR